LILVWRLIYPDTGLSHNILDTHFVADIDGDFPETFDGNLFLMLVMAVDGQEDIEVISPASIWTISPYWLLEIRG
jgi:hypothetical protein